MLSNKSILVTMSISSWAGKVKDMTAQRTVEKEHGVFDAGHFIKDLASKSGEFKSLKQLESDIRQYHYKMTLPWSDNNQRLLPSKLYTEYIGKVSEYQGRLSSMKSDFVKSYPSLIESARVRLGSLFNASEYPPPSEIADKFGLKISFSPVPESGDVRIDVSTAEVDKIKRQVEAESADRLGVAMKDVYDRLFSVVNNMAVKLNDPDGVFRDTLVSNVSDLLDILPSLNITNDQNLNGLTEEVAAKLRGITPDILRTNRRVRSAVAVEMSDITTKMKGFM